MYRTNVCLVVKYAYEVLMQHCIFIFMSIEKRWYIAIIKLSQQFSDNRTTEFWKKCDIMKIIK